MCSTVLEIDHAWSEGLGDGDHEVPGWCDGICAPEAARALLPDPILDRRSSPYETRSRGSSENGEDQQGLKKELAQIEKRRNAGPGLCPICDNEVKAFGSHIAHGILGIASRRAFWRRTAFTDAMTAGHLRVRWV